MTTDHQEDGGYTKQCLMNTQNQYDPEQTEIQFKTSLAPKRWCKEIGAAAEPKKGSGFTSRSDQAWTRAVWKKAEAHNKKEILGK